MNSEIGIIGSRGSCQVEAIILKPLGPNQVRIRVSYAGVNRADVEQSLGLYPPPPNASPVLGLECSGFIEEIGPEVKELKVGEKVMALLTGGGFATCVNADAECVLKIPEHLTMVEAAVTPESIFTFWANAVMDGGLCAGKTFLVHGGASGLGSFSLEMAKAMGCRTMSSARGVDRVSFIKNVLLADSVIDTENLSTEAFGLEMLKVLGEESVDVIMDHLGSEVLGIHLKILKHLGRIIFINAVTGEKGYIDLDPLIGKRIHMIGSLLRGRPLVEKDSIKLSIIENAIPLMVEKKLRPKVDLQIPLQDFRRAFERLSQRKNLGKVVLAMGS